MPNYSRKISKRPKSKRPKSKRPKSKRPKSKRSKSKRSINNKRKFIKLRGVGNSNNKKNKSDITSPELLKFWNDYWEGFNISEKETILIRLARYSTDREFFDSHKNSMSNEPDKRVRDSLLRKLSGINNYV